MELPERGYGMIVNKMLHEVREFHGMSKDEFPLPNGTLQIHEALGRILEILLQTVDAKTRTNLLDDLEIFKLALQKSAPEGA